MRIAPPSRRTSTGSAAAVTAAALVALGAAPASAAGPEPDLGVGTIASVKGVQPGSSFSTPLTFLNKGTAPVTTTYVRYAVSPGLKADETYKNCMYYTVPSHDEMPEAQVASCKIDQPLEPDVVYRTAKPLALKARPTALHDDLRVAISTQDLSGDDEASDPVPGTGDPLTLEEQGPASPADRENHPESYATAEVTAANTADFALTGAELKGEVGDKVTAKVVFANRGPAWVRGPLDQSVTTVDVRIPKGTSVVKADGFCDKVTKTHYRCGTSQSWVDADGGEEYTFVLRVDQAVGAATGEVSFTGPERPFDRNAANDTARIVIDTGEETETSTSGSPDGAPDGTATEGSGSTGSTGSSGGTDTSGGSAATGGSAVTGGSDPRPQSGGSLAATGTEYAGPAGGMAAAAVAAGGGIVWAVRRRSATRAH
ncbi:peptidase [Streptomyces sp. NPDC049916]|uniref:peptidase n=1 Tax=Streptomyces sp. NPDC049916 TaxID=3155156 RepID=UPI003433CF13